MTLLKTILYPQSFVPSSGPMRPSLGLARPDSNRPRCLSRHETELSGTVSSSVRTEKISHCNPFFNSSRITLIGYFMHISILQTRGYWENFSGKISEYVSQFSWFPFTYAYISDLADILTGSFVPSTTGRNFGADVALLISLPIDL